MAKGFKTKGSASPSDFNGLPALPEDVDDNLYLAAAANAAVADRNSGSYDEFLFSEHGMKRMPFEDAVDSHLDLVQLRLKDRGRRELLVKQQALLQAKARLAKLRASLETFQARLKSVRAKVAEQQAILDGKSTGKHGLYWPGSAPELTTKRQAKWRLSTPIITFALVGLVDIYVIWLSLQKLPGFNGLEAMWLALPAVGVQLVFPHFIGERIRLNLHGHAKSKVNAFEALLLAIAWVAFIWAMTQIRMKYIRDKALEETIELTPIMDIAVQVSVVTMLLALGSWLMLSTARSNPHEREIGRLQLAERVAQENVQGAIERITSLEAEIPILELAVRVSEESYKDAVLAAGHSLAEAAKSVYRRALVNQFGAVDFTTAYMADGSTIPQSVDQEIQHNSAKEM
ncbi:MAG: hypothetical protein RL645_1116 [Actinomycetota bacterium]|jgi:hypothetical protein